MTLVRDTALSKRFVPEAQVLRCADKPRSYGFDVCD